MNMIELRKGQAVNGYVANGMPVCKKCAPKVVPDFWQELNYDDMSDDPMHCAFCDSLIFTLLSAVGADYVRNSLAKNYGRADVLNVWRQAWPALASETMP